jgi:hypothetical protein
MALLSPFQWRSRPRVRKMPRMVMARLPSRCTAICVPNQRYCPRNNSVSASAEKVEKVVRPPRKPVMMSKPQFRRQRLKMLEETHHAAHHQAAAEVRRKRAQGRVGKIGLSSTPSIQRSQHPKAPPMPTARNPVMLTLKLPPCCDGIIPRQQARLRRRNPVVQASSTFRWFVPQRDGRHAISLMASILADAGGVRSNAPAGVNSGMAAIMRATSSGAIP